MGGKLINITKIKYINVLHKVYNVTDISFSDMIIKAVEADASIADIPTKGRSLSEKPLSAGSLSDSSLSQCWWTYKSHRF